MGPQPQTVSKADALAEAYKRGLLPPDKKAAYEEAQRRGLIKPAAPSLRSETDAIIEEAAAAIPGGFAAFDAKPADPQRMAAMGYVQDPLAVSGYAKPRVPEAPMVDTGNSNNLLSDIGRGLAAPLQRNENLRTAVAAPLQFGQGLGQGAQAFGNNVMAVGTDTVNSAMNIADPAREQFERPRVDLFDKNALLDQGGLLASDAGIIPRAVGQVVSVRVPLGKVSPYGGFGHQAAKDAAAFALSTDYQAPRLSDMISSETPVLGPVADLLRSNENDPAIVSMMKNLGEDLSISAVTAGLLKLVDGASSVARPGAKAGQGQDPRLDPALAAQIRRVLANEPDAPQVATPAPVGPKPFSAPAEPKASGFLRNNADRIVGGGVGAFAGSAGDALAAPGDGNEGGGPDVINPTTGAIAGMIAPRLAGRGWRAAAKPFRPKGFDERVVSNVLQNVLAPLGKTADEVKASLTAQYGDKPVSLADATQQAQNLGVGLSRLPGNAPELASQQAAYLRRTQSGRLFSDVEATTGINPATVTADLDAAIKQASEEISPAYKKLYEDHAGVNSERLMQLADDRIVGKYVRAAINEVESLATTAGLAPSNALTWDLVKRALDRPIDKAFSGGSRPSEALLRAREAVVKELDALMPEYAAVREGADAPRMKGARKKGAEIAGGGLSVEKVRAIASKLTGKPLTALQMGAVEKIVPDIEKGRNIDGLSSERMREMLGDVFDKAVADNLVARVRAEQVIIKNAQRRDPNVGSATSQAAMGGAGGIQNAAEIAQSALAFKTNPLATVLAALTRSGSYSKSQRDLMADILYGGATDENLARIYGNRPPRNPLNVTPPPAPSGPPMNALAPRRPEQAGFGGSKPTERRFANAAEADAEYKRLAMQIDEQRAELLKANVPRRDAYEEKLLADLGATYKTKEQEIAAKMPQWEKDFRAKNASRYDEDTLKDRADDYAYAMYNRETAKLDTWRDKQESIISDKAYKYEERLDAQIEKWHDAQYEELGSVFDELDFDGARGNPQALGAAGGTAIGMATAPDQNGDGVVDAQERMMGAAGGALTGGIAGRAMFRGGDRGAIGGGPQAQGFGGKGKPSTFIANTKATKPMATEFDGVDIQMPSDKSGTGRVAIKSERGDGEITFTLNERGDYVVKEARLDADMRGQGLGVKMYEALAQRAAASRRAMYSDSLVSGDAVKVYMALKRRGYNVRLANPDDVAENPNFRPSTWDENKNVLFPAGPKSKPGTIVASPSDPSVFKVTKYGIPAVAAGGSLIVIVEPEPTA